MEDKYLTGKIIACAYAVHNYLVATNMPIGLRINFGPEGAEVKRKYRNRKQTK